MLYGCLRVFFRMFFLLFFRAEIIGKENLPKDGAVILAANHMSNWDPPLLATYLDRPVCYMAKQELFEIPVFGTAIRHCHSFPVRRGAADRSAIKTAMQVLKQGQCLGVFPEGTRSKTGKLQKAEAGTALLAAMSKAPVVPAAIIGTNRIFSRGAFLPKLKVIYGEPMRFAAARNDKEALQEFSRAVMNRIAGMMEGA